MDNPVFVQSALDVNHDGGSRHILRLEKKSKIKGIFQYFSNVFSYLSIWKNSFKSLEKNCGCGVVSYFRFIAWLLKLNIAMLIILLSMFILPYVLIKPYNFEEYFEKFDNENVSNKFTKTVNCTLNTIIEDKSTYLNHFLNILQGKGPLENSPMFMGFYFNKSFFNISSDNFTKTIFNTPVAFGAAFGLCILLSLLATLYSSGKNYKNSLVDETEFSKCFGLSIFAGYDYGITKETRLVYLRNALSKKLKIEYQQMQENKKLQLLTTKQLALIYFIRIIINILFIGFILFVYVVIALAQTVPVKVLKYEMFRQSQVLSALVDYIPAVVMLFINIAFPIINNKVVLLEKYRATFAMGVCLKRVILVQATSILVFMITLLDQIKESNGFDPICQQTDKIKCWETFVGQQFYRLSFLGFVTTIIVEPIIQFLRAQLFQKKIFGGIFGPLKFDLSTEGVLLISAQTQCWMGLWFCPLLPVIMIVKLTLLFYIRKLMFMRNYFVPNMETLSVAGSQRFFQDMLSYSLAFVMLPIGYLLSKKIPSRGCSPFRIYDDINENASFSSSLRNYLSSISSGMETFCNILRSKYTPIIIIFCLVIIIYVKYAESKTQLKYQSILRKQIILTQKDKAFYENKTIMISNMLGRREALLRKI